MYLSLKDAEGWLDAPEDRLASGSQHEKKIHSRIWRGSGAFLPLFKDVPLDNLKLYFQGSHLPHSKSVYFLQIMDSERSSVKCRAPWDPEPGSCDI